MRFRFLEYKNSGTRIVEAAVLRWRGKTKFDLLMLCALFQVCGALYGAENQDDLGRSNRGYHLFARDVVRVSVHGESDLSVDRRIDGAGCVSLPLLGSIKLADLSASEAENAIASCYIEKKILKHPNVSVTVTEYFPREISVLGQVGSPGKVLLPIETESLSIADAISRAGGLTRIAKGSMVRVTRKAINGQDTTYVVDVDVIFSGRKPTAPFTVLAGDIIIVPERTF